MAKSSKYLGCQGRLDMKKLLLSTTALIIMASCVPALATQTPPSRHRPSACLMGANFVDGCTGAPSGTPLLPTLLSSYAARAPWNVAGVDYNVGVPPGTVLRDPTTFGLPAGCTFAAATVTCTSGTPILDAFDFSLHNGTTLLLTGGNATVSNSKFVVGTNQGALGNIIKTSGNGNVTLINNEIDGNNVAVTAQQGQTSYFNNTGTNIIRYNYFHNSGGDTIDFGFGTRTDIIQYNVFKDGGVNTAHSDVLQWFDAFENNLDISFNTVYESINPTDTGVGMLTAYSEGSPASMSHVNFGNNTIIQLAACTTCNYTIATQLYPPATGDHVAVHDNFIDPSGAAVFWSPGPVMWLGAMSKTGTGAFSLPYASPTAITKTTFMTTGAAAPAFPSSFSFSTAPDSNGYTPTTNDVYSSTAFPVTGNVGAGSTVTITLNMDAAYTVVGGTPTLALSTSPAKTASLTSGSGTSSLVFTYTVASGDTATDLAVTSLALNGATMKDAVGNTANLTAVAATFAGLSVGGSGGGCPFSGTAAVDGCTSSPSASAQFPTMFTGGSGDSYVTRPAWNVAGVDYGVGPPSGQTYINPSISVPAGCTYSTATAPHVTCSGSNISLNGYDLTIGGGVFVLFNNCNNCAITNSKMGGLGYNPASGVCSTYFFIVIQEGSSAGLTMTNNILDGGSTVPGAVGCQNYGLYLASTATSGNTATVKYNYVHNLPCQFVTIGASGNNTSVIMKYNLLVDMAPVSGAHDNYLQSSIGVGTSQSTDVEYNMQYQTIAGNGEFFQLAGLATGAITVNPVVSNNTFITNSTGVMSVDVHGPAEPRWNTAVSGTCLINNNYFDLTGNITGSPAGAFYSGSWSGSGCTASGNINLVSGATITLPP